MRIGIAHHLGWAVAVTASERHEVIDRRRIELIEPGVPSAPVHHSGGTHALHNRDAIVDDAALAALVREVRASAARATTAALDELTASVTGPILSISLRAWPLDFPADIAMQRRAPYESQADSVMYRVVLAEVARERGWEVHLFNAADVEANAARILGDRADAVLRGPRVALGPPWSKDHRIALASVVIAAASAAG